MNHSQPWLGLLWLVLLFWVTNQIMLTFLAIPSILSESVNDNFVIDENKVTNPYLINTIDKIKTEPSKDSRGEHDPLYWDDTHN